jgi:hypothetical protein
MFEVVSINGYSRDPSNSLYIRRPYWDWGFEQHVAFQDLQPEKQEGRVPNGLSQIYEDPNWILEHDFPGAAGKTP